MTDMVPYNRCGRIHLGSCLVNGDRADGTVGPICMWCNQPMTRADRELTQRTWDEVSIILAPYRKRLDH